MTRQPLVAARAESLLDLAVIATAPVAGGDVSTATKLRLSDGSTALMKTHLQTPPAFFETEAAGLRWLAAADGGVSVPEVLAVDAECLILRWVEPVKVHADAGAAFGAALAATHNAGAPAYGAIPPGLDPARDGFIGRLPMRSRPTETWADFYATQRVLPYLKIAHDRAAVTDTEAALIERVVGRLPELVPHEPPARLHGDLWNGNVLWAAEGRAWLIDPAAHGGHRETDLALLSLFGLPHLMGVMESYVDAAPLADGWIERQGLHQLFPLLVHACMFGGGYAARAAKIAARFVA